MRGKLPFLVTRDGPELTVEIDGDSVKMICDTKKWSCQYGKTNSGSGIRLTFKPK